MEIPFYTSFKEFKEHYKTDLEKWLNLYPDDNEEEYLNDTKSLYLPFLSWQGKYCFKDLDRLQEIVKPYKGVLDNKTYYTLYISK